MFGILNEIQNNLKVKRTKGMKKFKYSFSALQSLLRYPRYESKYSLRENCFLLWQQTHFYSVRLDNALTFTLKVKNYALTLSLTISYCEIRSE